MNLRIGPGDAGFNEVLVDGEIHAADLPGSGANPLVSVLPPGWERKCLVLDFAKVTFLGSAGISWLIGTNRILREAGAKLVVHSIKPLVVQQLSLTGTQRIVSMTADRAAAVQLLSTRTDGGAQ